MGKETLKSIRSCIKSEWKLKHFVLMSSLFFLAITLQLASLIAILAQETNQSTQTVDQKGATWRDADELERTPADTGESNSAIREEMSTTNESDSSAAPGVFKGPTMTRYSLELTKLPDSDGQFWVVYDIEPYTERFPNLSSPQDSLVEWILFDSGDNFWRKEPFSVLTANRNRLYVYHTSNVQRYVANIVDRFIDPLKRNSGFSIKMVAIQSPDWRARASQYLGVLPTTVSGTGADVQSWLIEPSNMTKIASELERRADYVLLNAVKNVVPNGETFGWAAVAPQKEFNRDYQVDTTQPAGYSTDKASVDEGFKIETTPLLSTTGEVVEILFRYRATVVERSKTFSMKVPTPTQPRQQLNVEKPMIVSCDFRGKIAFPRSKSAIIDLGLIPIILPNKGGESAGFVESVSNLVSPKTIYYDVLLLIEEAK